MFYNVFIEVENMFYVFYLQTIVFNI